MLEPVRDIGSQNENCVAGLFEQHPIVFFALPQGLFRLRKFNNVFTRLNYDKKVGSKEAMATKENTAAEKNKSFLRFWVLTVMS